MGKAVRRTDHETIMWKRLLFTYGMQKTPKLALPVNHINFVGIQKSSLPSCFMGALPGEIPKYIAEENNLISGFHWSVNRKIEVKLLETDYI